MTDIDKFVNGIFNRLLSHPEFYKGKGQYHSGYDFEIDGTPIHLDVFGKNKEDKTTNEPTTFEKSHNGLQMFVPWGINMRGTDGYRFYLTIEDKQYIVTGLNLVEEAEAIMKLESILQSHERKVLSDLAGFNIAKIVN